METKENYSLRRGVALAGAFLILCGIVTVYSWKWVSRSYARWADSESAAFAIVRRACRSNDPHAAFVAFLHWLDWYQSMSLGEFARRGNDPRLSDAIAMLTDYVYNHPDANAFEKWSGADLLSRAAIVRRRLRASARHSPTNSLPPLNPTQ